LENVLKWCIAMGAVLVISAACAVNAMNHPTQVPYDRPPLQYQTDPFSPVGP